MATRSDSLLDQVFSAVTLPPVGQTTFLETHHEESHYVSHSETHHDTHEHITSGVTIGNGIGQGVEVHRRNTVDSEDQHSEVSALSKATSVSVHSSVSQQSAQHYDFPPTNQYDVVPNVVVGNVIGGGSKPHSVASHKSGSVHSAHSARTHDSESTIVEGGVAAPIVVGGNFSSQLPTPIAVSQSVEHDAMIEQFRNLHGKEPSVVSSVVPSSVHIDSESEDSIAPTKLTASIITGHGVPVLVRSHDVEYSEFGTIPYQPSIQDHHHDTKSEDSFGFEQVEYVDAPPAAEVYHEHHHHHEEHDKQVVPEHVIEHEIYEPYQIVHENHRVQTTEFDEDHHDSVVDHYDPYHTRNHPEVNANVKNSRSNTASTYQSRQIVAQSVGPKITEELRPAVVLEEEETYVEPPVMAYVAPIPSKPPRFHHESKHSYNAYEDVAYHKDVVKSTTVVYEDVRYGPGVTALRAKFENGVPPPLSPVLNVKSHTNEHHHDHDHHHHHHHNQVEEQVHTQVGDQFFSSYTTDQHHYDVPFELHEPKQNITISSSSSSHDHQFTQNQSQNQLFIDHHYDSPTIEKVHSPAFYRDDQHHHYVPQIKVITEYRQINPHHHYNEPRNRKEGSDFVTSPYITTETQFKDFERVHHYVPSTPTSPTKEVRNVFNQHSYIPNSSELKRESRSVERTHHYLPEQPKKLHDDKVILTRHNYIPLGGRSKSEDAKVTVHQHQFIPLVTDHKKETVNIVREHNYLPLTTKEEAHEQPKQIERRNQYIPLTKKQEEKVVDVGRSHSYIPIGGNIEYEKHDINRQHHYYPVIAKKEIVAGTINQHHNFVPAHSKTVSDKTKISREHNYVPLATPKENPRHANNHSSHHHYLPLSTKHEVSSTDNVVREHQYLPLARKIEQTPAIATKNHQYVPLIVKSDGMQQAIDRHHHFVPLAMTKDNTPRLPREHGYIPLTFGNEQQSRVNLEHHHYLPPITTQPNTKHDVNIHDHQYYPLAAKKTQTVSNNDHSVHHYIPVVQTHQKPPQLPHEHHYYPIAHNIEEKPKVSHQNHHYLPPVTHQEPRQKSVERPHGYVPYVKKTAVEKETQQNHHYLPLLPKKEEHYHADSRHQYLPLVQKNTTASHATTDDHHYVPTAVPRTTKSEKVSEHVQLGGSRKSTVHSEHHHHHHHHHENHQDVPSRPSSVASSIKRPQHSRTSSVSTVRSSAPVQRNSVAPVVYHNYGDHQSVRVVKNVREYVNVFGATHVVPPPTPLAGVPRLPYSPRSPVSQQTFEPIHEHHEHHHEKSSRKSSIADAIGNGVHVDARKNSCPSDVGENAQLRSRNSTQSTIVAPIVVGGNVIVPRSRQSTLTKDNIDSYDHHHHHHHHEDDDDLVHVADMRKLFENYGPAHLPRYASTPQDYIH